MTSDVRAPQRVGGKYLLYGEIGTGGMAQVRLGRVEGALGFSRTVAVKRLHAHLAKDPDFVAMLVDEARLAGNIHHPNVVATIDVVAENDELFVVMEYVHGASLASLLTAARTSKQSVPHPVAVRVAVDFLSGLHAAHEALSPDGHVMGIVHRDVSPQNVLVGADGVSRVIDFGIAKARDRVQTTREGELKGKLGYMAPEQLLGLSVDRRTDVYGAAMVLWEMLVGRRRSEGMNEGQIVTQAVTGSIASPKSFDASIPNEIDQVVTRALAKEKEARFDTAADMAAALENYEMASTRDVAEWVAQLLPDVLDHRAQLLAVLRERGLAASEDLTKLEVPASSPSAETAKFDSSENKSRGPLIVAGVGVAFALTTAIALVATRTSSAPAGPSPSASFVSSASVAPSPIVVTTAAPTASSSSSAATSSASPAPSRTQAPVHRGKPVDRRCDPPFTIDSNGIRSYKRECVR